MLPHPETPCDIGVRTLGLFASILGAEAGNMALEEPGHGAGIYLGGRTPSWRNPPFLENALFMEAFLRKGPNA